MTANNYHYNKPNLGSNLSGPKVCPNINQAVQARKLIFSVGWYINVQRRFRPSRRYQYQDGRTNSSRLSWRAYASIVQNYENCPIATLRFSWYSDVVRTGSGRREQPCLNRLSNTNGNREIGTKGLGYIYAAYVMWSILKHKKNYKKSKQGPANEAKALRWSEGLGALRPTIISPIQCSLGLKN